MVAQQIDPWSMMSEVWEEEKIAKELSRGRVSLEGGAYGAGLPASIRQRFQFVEQSPRVVQ